MQARGPIHELVVDIDHYMITHIGFNAWQWPLPVDSNCRAVIGTVGICGDPSEVEVVIPSSRNSYTNSC